MSGSEIKGREKGSSRGCVYAHYCGYPEVRRHANEKNMLAVGQLKVEREDGNKRDT
jgi:hypothetical protein